MQTNGTQSCTSFLFCRIWFRTLLLAALWWILAGSEHSAWWLGVPVVIIAALTSATLSPRGGRRIRIRGLVPFVTFFLLESARGGMDVALRALHPRLPIAPAFVRYEFRLPEGPGRIFLVSTISLLPGTLSVELRDAEVLVHALDERMPVARNLGALEKRVAALFGLELASGRGSGDAS